MSLLLLESFPLTMINLMALGPRGLRPLHNLMLVTSLRSDPVQDHGTGTKMGLLLIATVGLLAKLCLHRVSKPHALEDQSV